MQDIGLQEWKECWNPLWFGFSRLLFCTTGILGRRNRWGIHELNQGLFLLNIRHQFLYIRDVVARSLITLSIRLPLHEIRMPRDTPARKFPSFSIAEPAEYVGKPNCKRQSKLVWNRS